jgi:hypothetical protein
MESNDNDMNDNMNNDMNNDMIENINNNNIKSINTLFIKITENYNKIYRQLIAKTQMLIQLPKLDL